MANRKRNIQMKFYVTEEEKRLIDGKMAQLPTRRYGAYLRKMAIDGYIIQLVYFTGTLSWSLMPMTTPPCPPSAGTSTRSPSVSTPEAARTKRICGRYRRGWMRYGSYKDASYQVNAESGH